MNTSSDEVECHTVWKRRTKSWTRTPPITNNFHQVSIKLYETIWNEWNEYEMHIMHIFDPFLVFLVSCRMDSVRSPHGLSPSEHLVSINLDLLRSTAEHGAQNPGISSCTALPLPQRHFAKRYGCSNALNYQWINTHIETYEAVFVYPAPILAAALLTFHWKCLGIDLKQQQGS